MVVVMVIDVLAGPCFWGLSGEESFVAVSDYDGSRETFNCDFHDDDYSLVQDERMRALA